MSIKLKYLSAAATLLAGFGSPGPAVAEFEVGGQVTVASDYMFRGVSQTMSSPALQLELDVSHDSGWYGYAWASNVDFTDSGTPDDGARAEVDIVVGYVHDLGSNVTLGIDASAYMFPGTDAGVDYDYMEMHTCLTVNDQHHFTIGYSDDVFNSGTKGVFYSVGSDFALSERLSLGLELAHYDLDDGHDMAYSYGVLSLAGELKAVGWELSYFTTTSDAKKLFYETTIDDRLILSLMLSF